MKTEYNEVQDVKHTRDKSIDIIKGIGIFCMVAGHCRFPFTEFVYLFHMAIFFIASGYCFKESNSENIGSLLKFIKRKFLTLWLPYVVWTAIFSCLHNLFIDFNIYTDNQLLKEYISGEYINIAHYKTLTDTVKNIIKALFLHGSTEMGGAFWFIATLMELSIAYCIIDFGIKKLFKKDSTTVIQIIISIIFLCLGFLCSVFEITLGGIDKVLSFYILFHGGYIIKKYKELYKDGYHLRLIAISFVILIILNQFGEISLGDNSYVNPLYLLIASFVGWQFLYELSYYIQKLNIASHIMLVIGQNSIAVVILHFLCFKIVHYIGVFLLNQPLYYVAAFPILYKGGFWWLAYICVALTIPVLLSVCFKKIKSIILGRKVINKTITEAGT